jgi:uncharacterized protein (TIGR02996 family)
MSDEAALLSAIIAHPDEDTPRLAYADWLTEHGDPDRAEFIRVQCRLADVPPGHPDWVDLTIQQDELFSRLRRRLTDIGEVPAKFYLVPDLRDGEEQFRRGFPYFIDCQTSREDWTRTEVERVARELERFVRTTTLRGVHVYSAPSEQLTDLLKHPVIGELTGLTLRSDSGHLTVTQLCRHLGTACLAHRIRHLGLDLCIHAGAAEELAGATTFDALERMGIRWIKAPKPVLEKLAGAAWFRRLRHFTCMMSDRAVAEPLITGLGRLPELHTLELPEFAAAALPTLASGKFPALARLQYNGPLGASSAKQLAKARFPALAVFEAHRSNARTDALPELLAAGWFEKLRVLALRGFGIGEKGVAALVAHPVAKALRGLDLRYNRFGAVGLAALAAPGAFPALTALNLNYAHDRDVAPADLVGPLSVLGTRTLRTLDLSNWSLGAAGARALAANPALAGLTHLTLEYCQIDASGAEALFTSPHLQNLVELELSNNAIKTGAEALADPAVMPRLVMCNLNCNNIPRPTAARIARSGLDLYA